jgi:hypothetical protein
VIGIKSWAPTRLCLREDRRGSQDEHRDPAGRANVSRALSPVQRAFVLERGNAWHQRGACRQQAGTGGLFEDLILHVIARSEATKQSRGVYIVALDCFAPARNDDLNLSH